MHILLRHALGTLLYVGFLAFRSSVYRNRLFLGIPDLRVFVVRSENNMRLYIAVYIDHYEYYDFLTVCGF